MSLSQRHTESRPLALLPDTRWAQGRTDSQHGVLLSISMTNTNVTGRFCNHQGPDIRRNIPSLGRLARCQTPAGPGTMRKPRHRELPFFTFFSDFMTDLNFASRRRMMSISSTVGCRDLRPSGMMARSRPSQASSTVDAFGICTISDSCLALIRGKNVPYTMRMQLLCKVADQVAD